MNDEIIKRLEIIVKLIAIDDSEIIELQIEKLLKLDLYNHLEEIIFNLKELNYDTAIININNYLNEEPTKEKYSIEEISLKKELKSLEKIIQELNQQKQGYENEINDFHIEYSLKLGDILEDILELEEQIELQKFQRIENEYKEDNIDSDEYSKAQDDYSKIKQEYENFSNEYEEIKELHENNPDLNNEDKKKLKRLFRKGMKLCHPDTVSDELKAQANKIAQLLNEANSRKDIKGVEEILISLENGTVFDFTSDKIDDAKLIQQKIEIYRKDIGILKIEIDNIKEDELFIQIQEIEDFDKYFIQIKKELLDIFKRLKIEVND